MYYGYIYIYSHTHTDKLCIHSISDYLVAVNGASGAEVSAQPGNGYIQRHNVPIGGGVHQPEVRVGCEVDG